MKSRAERVRFSALVNLLLILRVIRLSRRIGNGQRWDVVWSAAFTLMGKTLNNRKRAVNIFSGKIDSDVPPNSGKIESWPRERCRVDFSMISSITSSTILSLLYSGDRCSRCNCRMVAVSQCEHNAHCVFHHITKGYFSRNCWMRRQKAFRSLVSWRQPHS